MVTLSTIYTRTGDSGETGIGDGARVSKLDLRIVAGGSVDETNCLLGLAVAHCSDSSLRSLLQQLQQQLFNLGADISCPWNPAAETDRCPRVTEQHVLWLESQIDRINANLPKLNSFVLPGGTKPGGFIHAARSVCRRAELDTLRLQVEMPINQQIAIFLNRLSDLLFVIARAANDDGEQDVLWIPGQIPE